MLDDNRDECPFCEGAGYILEEKDMYYYFAAERIRKANKEKDKEWQRRMIVQIKAMKGVPMQPLATECPKCHGTGLRSA